MAAEASGVLPGEPGTAERDGRRRATTPPTYLPRRIWPKWSSPAAYAARAEPSPRVAVAGVAGRERSVAQPVRAKPRPGRVSSTRSCSRARGRQDRFEA